MTQFDVSNVHLECLVFGLVLIAVLLVNMHLLQSSLHLDNRPKHVFLLHYLIVEVCVSDFPVIHCVVMMGCFNIMITRPNVSVPLLSASENVYV